MLGKKIISLKKLAKKVKVRAKDHQVESSPKECLLKEIIEEEMEPSGSSSSPTTPTGFFAVYVGEQRQRFVVPMSVLSHPLFKMLLEKSCNEFGFQQKEGLVVPCSVSTFQEVMNAIECCSGRFDFGKLVEEFI